MKKGEVGIENLGKLYKLKRRRRTANMGLNRFRDLIEPYTRRGRERLTQDLWALRDVNLNVEPGEILGVIGHNGAGKTTLLKLLARITRPTEGRIAYRGRVLSLLELGLSFQQDLSMHDNIFLNGAMYGIPRAEVNKYYDEIVAFAELEDYLDVQVRHFSSGMYLRLAFSLAINLKPDILLADEVLAVGDIGFQQKCINRIAEAGEAGTTVLFVSHDMEAVERLCTRCICLRQGHLVREGTPQEVVSYYQDTMFNVQTRKSDSESSSSRNQFAEIVRAQLVDSNGKSVGIIRRGVEFSVCIVCKTHQPGVRFRIGFDLMHQKINLFRSMSPEIYEAKISGVYSVTCHLPANLVNEMNYTITPIMVFPEQSGESVPLIKLFDALSFRPYQNITGLAKEFNKVKLPGLLCPDLTWEKPTRWHSLELITNE